ncbi:MAG: hypothetical protein Q4A41_02620 [Bacillota bacterium]|nr:hypothetical protein [Bacillota bacterium]
MKNTRLIVLVLILIAVSLYAIFSGDGLFRDDSGEDTADASVAHVESLDLIFDTDPDYITAHVYNNTDSPVTVVVRVSSGQLQAEGKGEATARSEQSVQVPLPQKRSSEIVEISYDIYTDGELFASDRTTRKRILEEELSSYWNKGTFETIHDSIDYHFDKHGAEVDAVNIVDYARKALAYRNEIKSDKEKRKDKEFRSIYTVKESSGKVKAHKYKHKADKRYAILVDEDFRILSFGK